MISYSYHNNTKSPNIHEIKTGDSSTFENCMQNELSWIYKTVNQPYESEDIY